MVHLPDRKAVAPVRSPSTMLGGGLIKQTFNWYSLLPAKKVWGGKASLLAVTNLGIPDHLPPNNLNHNIVPWMCLGLTPVGVSSHWTQWSSVLMHGRSCMNRDKFSPVLFRTGGVSVHQVGLQTVCQPVWGPTSFISLLCPPSFYPLIGFEQVCEFSSIRVCLHEWRHSSTMLIKVSSHI